ncbi:PRK06851 family protein [Bacillus sp. HMF5848]|uniref:PRK06851 family protein n=1 Tax=Bacillus sp. HMF5848 TaxID=2495421 RepID=UPI0026CDC0FE
MTGTIRNYYASGNTARGSFSLFDSNLEDLDMIYILKGGPGTGKSSLMKTIGYKWLDLNYDIEFLHCSSDNNSVDGLIIPELKVGIVDGTAPHIIEPKFPGVIEQYINLGVAWNTQELKNNKDQIKQLTKSVNKAFSTAYTLFGEALIIHDEWEKIYIDNIDFNACNKLTEELIDTFFKSTLTKTSKVRHRFLGAATPKGPVDFIEDLTVDVPQRYFIKGRPGSGKSTMLKKLVTQAQERGYDVEVYHCGFDPNSLDMVIMRELGIAIFDSTAPHEHFPSREGDSIIDMYEKTIKSDTDEKYADKITDVAKRYKEKMQEGTSYLAQAKQIHDKLESFYVQAMDYSVVDRIRKQIEIEIEKQVAKIDLK